MATTIKGPGLFIAQFIGNKKPFNNLKDICQWASGLGFKAVQLPTNDTRFIDIKKAAESTTYADEIKGIVLETGMEISELSTHMQGQLVAVNPAYDVFFRDFAPKEYRNHPNNRTNWAIEQLKYAAKASRNLGLNASATFSGSLLWHTIYPWPQRPKGLVNVAFLELAKRWKPILDIYNDYGVDLCFELHPGEDLHDGVTFDRFLQVVNEHPRACLLYDPSHFHLQCLDYLQFIDFYHERIKMFHVKDAEFNPSGKQGVYGGYQDWINRAGRFRSLGDGQINFKAIFSKMATFNFQGWAILEWECALKNSVDGAREGAAFIKNHIINVTEKQFDDFSKGGGGSKTINSILGLE